MNKYAIGNIVNFTWDGETFLGEIMDWRCEDGRILYELCNAKDGYCDSWMNVPEEDIIGE